MNFGWKQLFKRGSEGTNYTAVCFLFAKQTRSSSPGKLTLLWGRNLTWVARSGFEKTGVWLDSQLKALMQSSKCLCIASSRVWEPFGKHCYEPGTTCGPCGPKPHFREDTPKSRERFGQIVQGEAPLTASKTSQRS